MEMEEKEMSPFRGRVFRTAYRGEYPFAYAGHKGGAVYVHVSEERCYVMTASEFGMVRDAMLDADQRRAAYEREELGRRAVEQAERLGR